LKDFSKAGRVESGMLKRRWTQNKGGSFPFIDVL